MHLKLALLSAIFLGSLALADAQMAIQDIARAPLTPRIEKLTQELRQDPSDAFRWMERGHAYALLGEAEKARVDLAHALELAPRNGSVLRGAGWSYFNLMEYELALKTWQRAATLADDEGAFNNYCLALGYWGVKDLVKAAWYYDQAVKRNPVFGTLKTMEKRTALWTTSEKMAIHDVYDTWRRGYTAEGDAPVAPPKGSALEQTLEE